MAFNVTVDTYTALKASGVYDAVGGTTASDIALQFKNSSLTSAYIINQAGEFMVADLFSFVIRTDKGVVTGIESDNTAYADAGCVDSTAQ